MPVQQPQTCRSAHLHVCSSLILRMDPHGGLPPTPAPTVHSSRGCGWGSRGSKQGQCHQPPTTVTPPPSDTSIPNKFTIHWTSKQTDSLVMWLQTHTADCNILFSKNKANHINTTEKPMGKDKTAICGVIAHSIFHGDPEWTDHFTAMPKRFTMLVTNHIS